MKIRSPQSSASSFKRSDNSDRPLIGSNKSTNSDDDVGGMYRSVIEMWTLDGGTAGRGWVVGAALNNAAWPFWGN
jgi:hypothetical protein